MDNPNHDPALQEDTAPPFPQEDNKAGATKRKRKDGSDVPTRAKRNRYISIAWYVRRMLQMR